MPKEYSTQFKQQAVDLVVVEGFTQVRVCDDLGISKSALARWLSESERASRAAGKPSDLKRARAEKKRLSELEAELAVMRAALAYVSARGLKEYPPK